MDLKAHIKSFEANFHSAEEELQEDGSSEFPMVWSGGVVEWDSIAPALYSSEERAITAWRETALLASRLKEKGGSLKLKWILRPELIAYQTTMADRKQRHRVVSDRYAVKSQFLVNGLKVQWQK